MVLSGLVSLVLLAAPQAGGPPGIEIGLVPIVRVTQAPAIDGQAEEAWSAAVKRRLERSKGPVPQSGDLQGSFRAMWDDTALYLFVEVLDDRKVRNQVNPWLDDSVEVYVDGDASRGDTYDDRNDHQYVFVWNDPTVHEAKGTGATGRPLRAGGVGVRLPHGDRAAVVGDRCDAEGRGRDRPRRARERQRRDRPRGQAHVVGRDGPGQRRPAPLRAGHAAADGVGRARGRRRPHDARERPARAERRRGRRSASSTTTSGPTRPA